MYTSLYSKDLYFRLLRYVRPYWTRLAAAIAMLSLLAISEPIFPALIEPLLDEGFTKRNDNYIKWIPVLMIVLFLARGIIAFSSKYLSSWVANRVVADLRFALFSHSLTLPVAYFDKNSSGKVVSHISNNPGAVTGAATLALTVLVRDTLTILALLAWLLWINWKLTTITLTLFPIMALVVRYFNKRMRSISKSVQYALADLSHIIEESSSNNRIVKLFNAAEFEKEKFKARNERHRNLLMKATISESAVTPLVQLLASISVAIIVAIALNAESHNATTAGEFMSFLTALLMLLPPIKRLADITSTVQRGMAAAEIIFGLLDHESERNSEIEKSRFIDLDGDIVFDHVEFSYANNKKILHDLSFKITKNSSCALVGHSGSGKSTIVNLLAGFYTPNTGSIRINDHDIRTIPLIELRKSISFVSQDVRLFDDTILNNVAYSDPKPDEQKAMQSLENAYASEFVGQLKDGIHSLIGQNGVMLSGGQRQRLAIARAFYKESKILLLDEATSALDNESEHEIKKALERLLQNRTSIIIAHRLSTIKNCDTVLVLDNGRITESGPHSELLAKSGHYKKLYLRDFA